MIKRRTLLAALGGTAAAWPLVARAQQIGAIRRIGWLTAQRTESLAFYLEALRGGLSDLGYELGRNLVIEYRYGNDAIERVPELAAELVGIPEDCVGLKAKTPEGLNTDNAAVGHVVVLLRKARKKSR